MTDDITQPFPSSYTGIQEATKSHGFTMASDVLTCSLLRTLAASKPKSRFLELGTGTGLATSWMLDGMDQQSTLVSVDNDQKLLDIAKSFLGHDHRLELVCSDGEDWIIENRNSAFDFVFADTWHGKYLMLDEVLNMVAAGGFYIIDDMLPQSNWPDGHDAKVKTLLSYLDGRSDFFVAKQKWASGIVVAVKKSN
jgi:predicted O-methyltransferase YrrM